MVRMLCSESYSSFIAAKSAAAIHFDAPWDGGRLITRQRMREAEEAFGEQVNFGEVDCDQEPQLAQAISLSNVPLVAYYRDGQLVATLVGVGQNIRARVERVLRGEPIGHDDGTGPGITPIKPRWFWSSLFSNSLFRKHT